MSVPNLVDLSACQYVVANEQSHSAVNQRIAIKFVTMLGFQVAATWNGKEALDYIHGAQVGQNPKPNIILMDCQMPVVDGYKCTHA